MTQKPLKQQSEINFSGLPDGIGIAENEGCEARFLVLTIAFGLIGCFRNTQLFQNCTHGTILGQAVLKQVKPHKCGKQKPVRMNPDAKHEADENKSAGNYVYPVVYRHDRSPFFNTGI